jgi:hypothetical protein
VPVTVLPTIERVRAWCGVSVTSVTEEDLQVIYDGEADNQGRVCRLPDPLDPLARTDDQVSAFYRRCARAIAAKGVPLGTIAGNDEYGPQALARFDAEIERYEGPTRRFVSG